MPQPFSRHVAMAQWINASPIFRPRRSLATRTASIRPRRIPPRESPAMKLSCGELPSGVTGATTVSDTAWVVVAVPLCIDSVSG